MATSENSSDAAAAKTYTIEASVPTGFESVAAEEAKEMFQTECRTIRGKITFPTPAERVKDILKLGGIDHCRAQILHIPHFNFTDDGDDCLARLQLLVKSSDWAEGLEVWNQFYSFPHPIPTRPSTIPTDEELIDVCHSVHMPGHQTAGQGGKKGRKERRKGRGGRGGPPHKNAREGGKSVDTTKSTDNGQDKGQDEEKEVGHVTSNNSMDGAGLQDGQSADRGATMQNGEPTDTATLPQGEQPAHSPSKNHAYAGEVNGAGDTEGLTNGGCSTQHVNSGVGDGDIDVACHALDQPAPDGAVRNGAVATEDMETPAQSSPSKKRRGPPPDPTKPVFRVTCKRTGEHHSFDSMSAAASFGSAIQTYFGWGVDMTNYNIEVMLTIDNFEVSVGLTLTPESLHKRNLVAFGVTTLRPTICHNMLRMVKIRPGHVVCDPLCGTGSISIQGALSFPAFQLAGDNHPVAMDKTHQNHAALNAKRHTNGKGALMMDAVQWNACSLPLRDGVVDVFVSDLPFGKRVGRKYDNWKLYCTVLDEMARCGKMTARAALLTGDVNNMVKAIQNQRYWTRRRCYSCNIGGIAAGVFLLCRSNLPYTPRKALPPHRHHHPSSHHQGPRPTPPSLDDKGTQSTPVSSDDKGTQPTSPSSDDKGAQPTPASSDHQGTQTTPPSLDEVEPQSAPEQTGSQTTAPSVD
ncbi:uncharacterized protein LOC143299408 [Babylonia areolata]|uniref:uncharacterized protein LOC143299408 n=1 Tax=Babylonia areolata TaxID=304850 RepID=UPI003FD402DB